MAAGTGETPGRIPGAPARGARLHPV